MNLFELAVFAFFTGLGTTFGTELAKTTINMLRERLKENHRGVHN